MPIGLNRYQNEGDDHFITFSCYNRIPYFNTPGARNVFLNSLERTRSRYAFRVLGFVVMPEHVHLLLNEPEQIPLSRAIHSLKLSVSKRLLQRPFWTARYYDFNVFTHNKRTEKLHYMHQNPVTRGLVNGAADWQWSSYCYYATNAVTPVQITGL